MFNINDLFEKDLKVLLKKIFPYHYSQLTIAFGLDFYGVVVKFKSKVLTIYYFDYLFIKFKTKEDIEKYIKIKQMDLIFDIHYNLGLLK